MTHDINLDFDAIKQAIKDYLSNQSEFSDYDFDGSSMTVLLNALAYAAHVTGLTANLVHSEAYLDSASIRKNVVSRAKDLNYIPRSITSATATLHLSITPTDSPALITVPKGTKFTSTIDSNTYTFTVMDDQTLTDSGGGVYEGDIEVVQGVIQSQTWIHNVSNPVRFILDQQDVDSRYISVSTKTNPGATATQTWTEANSIITLDPSDYAYFKQEAHNGNVEVYFSDGIISKGISNNYVITVEYLASKGGDANGADNFSLVTDISGYSKSLFTVTTVVKGQGGSARESIESIKLLAPKIYQAQNRTVTVDDYSAIILNRYGWVDAVNVWGGEDNVPAQYGRVFISIKPNYGLELSPATKNEIKEEILDKHSIVGIIPEIVDPEYLYVIVDSEVVYDKYSTTLGSGSIKTLVEGSIDNYFLNSEGKFNNRVLYSKLVTAIDNTNASIQSNLTSISLAKKITAVDGTTQSYTPTYGVALTMGTVVSDSWIGSDLTTSYYMKDDKTDGKIYLYKDDIKQGSSIGYVDYTNGIIYLTSFVPDVNINEVIRIKATPKENNVYVRGNNLILLDERNVVVEDLTDAIGVEE